MRTTIDIHDPLLERAKGLAARQGRCLADVVNDALSEKLNREERSVPTAEPFRLLTFGGGGVRSGIDLTSNASLQELMDEDARDPATGEYDLDRLK